MDETVDILVFGAHPDDVELSCGGLVARSAAEGRRVGIVDLTHGEMGTRGTPKQRLRESLKSQKILRAAFRTRLDLGDGALRTGREEELQVIDLIRRHRPSLVVAPYPDDRHPDHTRAGRLVTEASFYAGLKKVETDRPGHRPHAVIYFLQNYPIQPSFIVDVSAWWSRKMKAVAAYGSQFYNPDSNEPETKISQKSFLDLIEGRDRFYGAMIGAAYGEPFVSKLPPRVDDPVGAYEGREVS